MPPPDAAPRPKDDASKDTPAPDAASGDASEAPGSGDLRRRLEWFAKWSDDVYRIPFTSKRIGLEPLLGLIPGVGDAAGLLVATYVPFEAWRNGAPRPLIKAMLKTIAIDAAVGLVPILGDVFDATYRANRRNATRLIEWLDAQDAERASGRTATPSATPSAPSMDAPEPRTEPPDP